MVPRRPSPRAVQDACNLCRVRHGLSIDVPREARRRIHIAAAKRDQSIRDYGWEAVEARLKHDLADELSAADLVALNARADPVLADLWNNPKDAADDKL